MIKISPEDYIKKIEQIEKHALELKKIVAENYAEANNPHVKGDVIEDHRGKAEIIDWKTYKPFARELPCLVYRCNNLTKAGKISKREPIRYVYQQNLR